MTAVPTAQTEPARLVPRDGPLYVVRWIRKDGRDVRHRYYRRYAQAAAFALTLRSRGRQCRLFETETNWQDVG